MIKRKICKPGLKSGFKHWVSSVGKSDRAQRQIAKER